MSPEALLERALILAGGLGTRLASVLPDRPKVLAPIGHRPFLDILIDGLVARGLRRFVLLLGSRHEQVITHLEARLGQWPASVSFELAVEAQPLGTGGAVKNAARFCDGRFFLLNGDTYFDLDVPSLVQAHERTQALVTIAAANVDDADRYGRLEVSADGLVERFRKKDQAAGAGLINAGIYLVEPALLGCIPAERAVSLEREVFPALLASGQRIGVSPQKGAFFDIGTPASYASFVQFSQATTASRQGKAGGTS